MKKVIAIFDIGKTNKKILLFDENLNLVKQTEERIPTITDEDGIECDNIDRIEKWMFESLSSLENDGFELVGINFSTYGATLVWLDENGNRLTPIYNYLKPIDAKYKKQLFDDNGGENEFCRITASPSLDNMLNSGVQIPWIINEKKEIFNKSKHILHFPQYLSSIFTKKYVTEYTSIGCHTFMWDFDKIKYHKWIDKYDVQLPSPVENSLVYDVEINGKTIKCGVGIHDSSASLAPYLKGEKEPFLLISTGTWCINMNPFNHSPLTAYELENDTLAYMSINQKPVKSSRFFLGYIHDVNVEILTNYFGVEKNSYKKVALNEPLLDKIINKKTEYPSFFVNGITENYKDETIDLSKFDNFEVAYHQLMFDLTKMTVDSIKLVLHSETEIKKLFISGGFVRNTIFIKLIKHFLPKYKIAASEVDNSSAMGAALVIFDNFFPATKPNIDLGIIEL